MQSSVDDLVQYTQLFKSVATVFQGTIFPFLIIYPVVFYSWIFVYGFEDNFEAGFVTVAVVAIVQILICLCCYWSVHIQCFLSCSSVSNCHVKQLVFFISEWSNNNTYMVSLRLCCFEVSWQ